ncbi:hypothetical protein DH2020_024094 [Rehmannia glutinosa]|uniref:Plastid lipid-associated protein/fibrillin conserved domain-containing protein n=1 Tax=Rehmannia glutinosa TaxID=99300 RepID=A0ABR0WAW2_REHGL
MATFCFSSSTTLLHSSIDFYSATIFSPKRLLHFSSNKHSGEVSRHLPNNSIHQNLELRKSGKWRTRVSFFSSFLVKNPGIESLKQELLEAIAPLDRGAAATPEDQQRIDQIARKLEAINKVKEPLKSTLLNGKWELLYTTSKAILQNEVSSHGDPTDFPCNLPWSNLDVPLHVIDFLIMNKRLTFCSKLWQRPKFLRPNGKIYQAINVDTLRAQNMETWPFFNQATANLVPLNARRVAVKFDTFKIAALIPIKSRGSGRGQLEITYLDEELRISRGNQGNLFILRMVDPLYRVPL